MLKFILGSPIKDRVMAIQRRNAAYIRKTLPYQEYMNYGKYHRALAYDLNVGRPYASELLTKQRNLFDIPVEEFVEKCQLFSTLPIDWSTLHKDARLMFLTRHKLENRVAWLQDMGVPNIHAYLVSNWHSAIFMRTNIFKALFGIPKELNVAENLLSCLHSLPEDVQPLEMPDEDLSLIDYYRHCLRWYLRWRLEIPENDEKTMSSFLKTLSKRSFSILSKLFDFLHNEIGVSVPEIRSSTYNLNTGSANDLSMIIQEIPTFSYVDMKRLIKNYPDLVAMDYHNVLQVTKLLDMYNVTIVPRRHVNLLLANHHDVAWKLEKFHTVPEFRILKENSASAEILYRMNTAVLRLNYLRYMNMKFASVRTLTTSLGTFQRYLRTGDDRTKGKEISLSLSKKLGMTTMAICKRFVKHPHWKHSDILSIHETLDFLLEHFKRKHINENLPLLLYPKAKVAEALLEIVPSSVNPEDNRISIGSHLLRLCLYNIEREHGFSGDGIWQNDPNDARALVRPATSKDCESSETSDSDVSEPEDEEEVTAESRTLSA